MSVTFYAWLKQSNANTEGIIVWTHPPLSNGCCERELLDWWATLQFDMATFEAFSVERGDNSFDDMTTFEACSVDERRAFFKPKAL